MMIVRSGPPIGERESRTREERARTRQGARTASVDRPRFIPRYPLFQPLEYRPGESSTGRHAFMSASADRRGELASTPNWRGLSSRLSNTTASRKISRTMRGIDTFRPDADADRQTERINGWRRDARLDAQSFSHSTVISMLKSVAD